MSANDQLAAGIIFAADVLRAARNVANATDEIYQHLILTIVSDVPRAISTLTIPSASTEQQQNAALSVALLLLGHGYPDECHNIVTPLSWNDDTHFGYGPSVYSTASPSVVSAASYVHSLVHRKEAFNSGEYGMTGFSNANYWSNASHRSRGADTLPYGEMRNAILAESKDNAEAEAWCKERIIEEGGDDSTYWEMRALHELAARVSRPRAGDEDAAAKLKGFAERACELELRVLLKHCLNGAGYDCPDCTAGVGTGEEAQVELNTCQNVDETTALVAGNKVSSAHLSSFRNNGAVTLRNVLRSGREGKIEEVSADAAAAGLAARLLDAPAVRIAASGHPDDDDVVKILLPRDEAEADAASTALGSFAGGGSLSPGDIFATRGQIPVDQSVDATNNITWRTYQACNAQDHSAVFVDKLYGSKGETPTTVIQWSKGTVHKSQ